MNKRHLEAKGRGVYKYDYSNDILLFKVKDRYYKESLDFGNLIADIDSEKFITGVRIFDASKIFKLPKIALNAVKKFEFNSEVEGNRITIKLNFVAVRRNRPLIQQGQNFVTDFPKSPVPDNQVLCTVI